MTRKKILLVDDDPGLLEMYRELLAQLPSRPEICTAPSGTRAMAMLEAEPFRLLVCDLKMPKMDGLQVLSIVRRKYPELRTVALTAVLDEQFRSRVYALGVDLFWHKPATPQETKMFLECLESLLGQDADSKFLQDVPGVEFKWDTVVVDGQMMTGHPGLFAGGDMVPAERTVTVAVGHGKKAARCIDAWLRGTTYDKPASHPVVTFDMLHLPVFSDVDPAVQRHLAEDQSVSGFDEVLAGLTEHEAQHEAQRCLSCGNCFECDNCLAACPEGAITKVGPGLGYSVDDATCTGCSVCFQQCPCHAIEMVDEP